MKAAPGIPDILRPFVVSSKALPMVATSFLRTRVKDCTIQTTVGEVGIEDNDCHFRKIGMGKTNHNMIKLITDTAHYSEVLALVPKVKRSLWIGTADIKDLYVKVGSETKPFLSVLAQLIKKGVEVRLIHAKEPGPAFREDFDKYPALFDGLERVLCPRVHFKILVFDGQLAYIGSANLTGAGIGMKGEDTRNFEAGILTDIPELVAQAMNQFDDVWIGRHCKTCKRREFCSDPIA